MTMQPEDFTKIESIFVRHRNCLMVRGQFIDIHTDHYLHLSEQKIRYPEELDQMLKDALAMLTLHQPPFSRPPVRPMALSTAITPKANS